MPVSAVDRGQTALLWANLPSRHAEGDLTCVEMLVGEGVCLGPHSTRYPSRSSAPSIIQSWEAEHQVPGADEMDIKCPPRLGNALYTFAAQRKRILIPEENARSAPGHGLVRSSESRVDHFYFHVLCARSTGNESGRAPSNPLSRLPYSIHSFPWLIMFTLFFLPDCTAAFYLVARMLHEH